VLIEIPGVEPLALLGGTSPDPAGRINATLALAGIASAAVATLGRAYYRPARLDDLRCRRHTFHCLIKILIKRIARVRCQHNVEWRVDRTHDALLREHAGLPVFGEQLTGKDCGDVLIAIQRDVDRKGDAGRPRDLADVVLDGIAVNHAPRRVWATDAFGVV